VLVRPNGAAAVHYSISRWFLFNQISGRRAAGDQTYCFSKQFTTAAAQRCRLFARGTETSDELVYVEK